MKPLERLGALERQIRGWLPMKQAAGAARIQNRRSVLMIAAGDFFLLVGVYFLRLEQLMNGPVTYVNCIPGMVCDSIELNTSTTMPPFLIGFGAVVIAIGLYYHSRHRLPGQH